MQRNLAQKYLNLLKIRQKKRKAFCVTPKFAFFLFLFLNAYNLNMQELSEKNKSMKKKGVTKMHKNDPTPKKNKKKNPCRFYLETSEE